MIRIPNNKIAVEFSGPKSIEVMKANGFARGKQKVELLRLPVVFPAMDSEMYPYRPGEIVHIRGDSTTLPCFAEEYTIEGRKCILIPCDLIQAWDDGVVPVPVSVAK